MSNNWIHNKQKIEYVWKVGDILKTTREICFTKDDRLPKGSIIKVLSRNQGYLCICLRPAYFPSQQFRVRDDASFEEISDHEWVSILND